MARKSGLGKGLDSLISSNYRVPAKKGEENDLSTKVSTKQVENVEKSVEKPVTPENKTEDSTTVKEAKYLKITEVEPNRDQPRKKFDEEALEELAESIRKFGILQPLVVQPKDGHYVIIAGERRWRAARIAGLTEIPAIVKEYTSQEVMEISLIENIQREDLNAIEEARAYEMLIREYGYRQEDLGTRLSRSRTAITNKMRLLSLTEQVQGMVIEGSITEGHARALLPLKDGELQFRTAMKVMDEDLSVRATEKLVKSMLEPKPEMPQEDWRASDQFVYDKWEEDLKISMGTKVSIHRKQKDKGQIMIDYYSVDELERLLEMLQRLK